MPRTLRYVLLACWAVAAWGQAARQEVAFVNGTAVADEVVGYLDGSVRLSGRVEVHAEQLGTSKAQATLKADVVTVIIGENQDGELDIAKMFARGNVDIVAHQELPKDHESRHLTARCGYLQYVAADEEIRLEPTAGQPVDGSTELRRQPQPKPDAEPGTPAPAEEVVTIRLNARQSAIFKLTSPPEGELELRQEP